MVAAGNSPPDEVPLHMSAAALLPPRRNASPLAAAPFSIPHLIPDAASTPGRLQFTPDPSRSLHKPIVLDLIAWGRLPHGGVRRGRGGGDAS